ncbi:hypothetical protein EZS27_029611, partial [termite gut metagenome]
DKLGFQRDELAVLSALTIGYQEDLSEEIRDFPTNKHDKAGIALKDMRGGGCSEYLPSFVFLC